MIERVFVKQGIRKIELENYLKKELDRAGFTGLAIVKTPLVTRIVLNVVKPGLAIGKEGQNIRQLTEEIGSRFGIDNPQLEIQETPHASLNALAIVNKMAALLERGFSWRSIAFRTVNDIMAAGAQGAELVLSGKLAGKGGRKRKQRIAVGYMKKVGEQIRLVDYAKASAYPKAGAIGIKLRIIHPGVVFPDKIDVKELLSPAEEPKAEAEKAEEEKATEATEKEEKSRATEAKEEKPKKEAAKEKKTEKEKPAAKKKKKGKEVKEKAEKTPKKKKEAGKDRAAEKGETAEKKEKRKAGPKEEKTAEAAEAEKGAKEVAEEEKKEAKTEEKKEKAGEEKKE